MNVYVKYLNEKTPQTKPIPGLEKEMVENNAGGFAFKVTPLQQFYRFLILGTAGNSYYVTERNKTMENFTNIENVLLNNFDEALDMICKVSNEGLAMSNSPAIVAHAFACKKSSRENATKAYARLSEVVRTGAHLLEWVSIVKQIGTISSGTKRAIIKWYLSRSPEELAYQLTKYSKRQGWSQRDVLRLVRPAGFSPRGNPMELSTQYGQVFEYVVKGTLPSYPTKHLKQQCLINNDWHTSLEEKIANDIVENKIVRELVPTTYLSSDIIWSALAEGMPYTALIRNLGTLSKNRVFNNTSLRRKISNKIEDQNVIQYSRVHPISLLLALKQFSSGGGYRSNASWDVNQQIVQSLDKAFYSSFKNLPASNKTLYLALDVSGSMTIPINNSSLSSMEAGVAMYCALLHSNPDSIVRGFSDELISLDIHPSRRLDDNLNSLNNIRFGSTDCAKPIVDALNKNLYIDCFVVFTDNETYYGNIHPYDALIKYRKQINPQAKLIVCATEATNFSIARQNDPGMLDVVGFDANLPTLIQQFADGTL